MALPHRSVATIDNVEFVNLTPLDISPLISKCEIKVFYIGKNRNGSFINKEVATEMAKSLRGNPIVGWYKEQKEDYADHGHVAIIDDEGLHFKEETRPYGFVAPDAKVWFKKFEEQDDFGNPVEREYLMTEGFLWTGQYKEAQQVLDDNGKPQSMELDEETLQGHWAEDPNDHMSFFIISDAIVSKLCILGDDVEPCFEGAAVTAPEVSASFSFDDRNFKKTLFSMMQELQTALQGGKMFDENKNAEQAAQASQTVETDFSTKVEDEKAETSAEKNQYTVEGENSSPETSYKKDEDEESKKKEDEGSESKDGESKEAEPEKKAEDEDKEKESKKKPETKNSLHSDEEYEALENKFNELNTKFELLQKENEELQNFKNTVEDEQKDALINKFYMLSDEDKKEVIENKRNFTLDEIESKLAVIGYRKGVNFDLNETENKKSEEYSVNVENIEDSVPDWVKAVRKVEKTM